jgi:cation diffusion facilitator family transporter
MMDNNNKNSRYIRIAALIAIAGNTALAVIKIGAGLLSKSGALLGDGIDSSADVFIGIITLAVVRIISKPADAEHPWGHGRAETVATAFLSFVIFFAGAQLIYGSLADIVSGRQDFEYSIVPVAASLVSIAGKIALAWSQHILGKRANSAMIKANAKNMTGDILISLSALSGIAISNLTGSAYADSIMAILIGLWIIRTAVSIFLEANLELMDGNSDTGPYQVIVEAVNAIEGAARPHRARMRRIAGYWDISFDISVDPKCSIAAAHNIATQVEKEIKKRVENVFDIMVHVEPRGDNADETFGLSEDDMRGDNAEQET